VYKNNSGKRHVLTEGVNLSGTNTDGVIKIGTHGFN